MYWFFGSCGVKWGATLWAYSISPKPVISQSFMVRKIELIIRFQYLHLTNLGAFPASLGTWLAVVGMFGVLATFYGTCFAAFYAEGAQRIGELRIPCTEPCAERTDVGAVPAGFHAGFVPAHGQALGGAFFAFDDTGEAGINAVLAIYHVFEFVTT